MTPRLEQAHKVVGHHIRKSQKRGVQVTDFGKLLTIVQDARNDVQGIKKVQNMQYMRGPIVFKRGQN